MELHGINPECQQVEWNVSIQCLHGKATNEAVPWSLVSSKHEHCVTGRFDGSGSGSVPRGKLYFEISRLN